MKKLVIVTLISMVIISLLVFVLIYKKDIVNNMNIFSNSLQHSTIMPEQLNILEEVSLALVEYDLDNNTIVFTLKNNSSNTIYFGEYVILEKKLNDEWYVIPYSDKLGFTDILNYLPPSKGSKVILPVNAWIPVTAGEYRIIKEVSIQEGLTDIYLVSAVFTISK